MSQFVHQSEIKENELVSGVVLKKLLAGKIGKQKVQIRQDIETLRTDKLAEMLLDTLPDAMSQVLLFSHY